MGNSLMNYLNSRLKEEKSFQKGHVGDAGPVITISREVGCNGLKLANLLAIELNKQRMLADWKVLSKEIFYESARELNLAPEKILKALKKEDSYTFEQILTAFGEKRYKSEAKIVNTVKEVVRSLAINGFNIIVGRASHIIAADIKNALHIRLEAPLEYRIRNIMCNNNLSRDEAKAFIERVEKERIAFRKAIRLEQSLDVHFDMMINRASFTDREAVELIMFAIEKKRILADYKQKIDFF
ncbi:cytidylate kinase-like family protein [Maribellus sp. YY47]|uniref:cytidylate kinase-like family protein n=1 Tax=Maribellus sp. YY47 TaxID=2929486 RepID=UPI00200069B6|nr:cytidylate kinase-like family protein [Maribellus sp. YY47]MCK3684809.1 cytidylate kinase-like family protein [Maribellus sp. YY47]